MTSRNWWVAVIGSGPAGLYAADALSKRGAQVDVFESQFAPFGLVRFGVAPDHQKIKKTQVIFEKILARPAVRLFGNVRVGKDVSIQELLEHYDQVLVSVGSSGARDLDIPGEQLLGSTTATEFVGWYNGHPDHVNSPQCLSGKRAVVLGMGNVAIDVARVLLKGVAQLEKTDIAQPALDALAVSSIREVILYARRGPNQAAFDNKEVRELASTPGIELCVDGYISKRSTDKSDFISSFPRATSERKGRRVVLHFCASPIEILGEECVEGVRVERNDLVESAARMRAVGTGEISIVQASLVVRAIGYRGEELEGVPFCADTATVPHLKGRVLHEREGHVVDRLYVAGWIKRGPTGLIGTNKSCALETVRAMEEDLGPVGPLRDPSAIGSLLFDRGVKIIDADDWKSLEEYEVEQGVRSGRVRQKIHSVERAFSVLSSIKRTAGDFS